MNHDSAPGPQPAAAGAQTTAGDSSSTGGRRRLLRWLVPAAVLALLVGVGVPVGAWAADRAAAAEAASADAARLDAAVAGATEASARFEATAGLAIEFSETTAVGVRDLVAGRAGEFSADAAGALTGSVDALTASLAVPVAQDAAAASSLDWAPAAGDDEVRTHYEQLGGEEREAARRELSGEVQRLDGLAEELDAAEAEVRAAVDAVDAAIVAAAGAGAAAGAATIAASGYASAEAKAALEQSVAALQAVAGTSLPVDWTGRAETPPFVELGAAAQGYVDAAAAVRDSHTANTPAPEPEPEESWDGGDGGDDASGSEYRWCYLPDPFGFTYQVPC